MDGKLFETLGPDDEARAVPLLVDLPHSGTFVPDALRARMTREALLLADTDWHLLDIYRRFVPAIGGRILAATHSRYVVDLNRPSDGASLYPGRDETGLVPVSTFSEHPIYRGEVPDAGERQERTTAFWAPYHARLRSELDALVERFGYALLWDGHSIRGHVPRFCDQPLPDLMLGDFDGRSCPASVSDAVLGRLERVWSGSVVRNHIFRGGHITRSYGDADGRVFALQMEMSQRIYMDEEAPFPLIEERAAALAPALRAAIEAYIKAGARSFGKA
jgi:N-formylglutamate deformylase